MGIIRTDLIIKEKVGEYSNIPHLDLSEHPSDAASTLSKGVLPKWKIWVGNDQYMIKTSSIDNKGEFNTESIVECIVYQLCKAWGIDCAIYLPIKITYIDNTLGKVTTVATATKWFLSEGEEIITHRKIKSTYRFNPMNDDFINYVDILPQLVPQICRMILLDYIIQNHDRHSENFGAIISSEIYPSPLFDNGCGLFGSESQGDSESCFNTYYGKAFKTGKNGNKDSLQYINGWEQFLPDYDTISNKNQIQAILRGFKPLLPSKRLASIYSLICRRISDVRYLYTHET